MVPRAPRALQSYAGRSTTDLTDSKWLRLKEGRFNTLKIGFVGATQPTWHCKATCKFIIIFYSDKIFDNYFEVFKARSAIDYHPRCAPMI